MVRLIRVGPMHGVRAIKTQVQESRVKLPRKWYKSSRNLPRKCNIYVAFLPRK